MKAFAWAFFLLIIGGILYFGYAKIVLLTVLTGGALFVLAATVCGIVEWAEKQKPKPPDLDNPSGDAQEARERLLVMQAHALRTIPCTATDEELKRLRKMAGLL